MVCTVISSDGDNGEDPTPERVTHYGYNPNTKRSEEKRWAHFLAFLPLSPACALTLTLASCHPSLRLEPHVSVMDGRPVALWEPSRL